MACVFDFHDNSTRHMLNNSNCASIAKLLHGVKLLFRSIGKIVRNKNKKKIMQNKEGLHMCLSLK